MEGRGISHKDRMEKKNWQNEQVLFWKIPKKNAGTPADEGRYFTHTKYRKTNIRYWTYH